MKIVAILFLFIPIFLSASARAAGQLRINQPNYSPGTPERELTPEAGIHDGTELSGGLRFDQRIVDHGFVKPISNSVSLDFAAFLQTGFAHSAALESSGGMRWDFNLSNDWTVFALPELRLVFQDGMRAEIGFYSGGLYRLSRAETLRLELGTPLSVNVGWVFYLD